MGRLLIVRPDPALEEALRSDPSLSQQEVECCEGNVEAVRRTRGRPIDVLLTDPLTTVTEDLALTAELHDTQPGVRIIVLAPAASHGDVVSALKAHVFACFTAPFDYSEVVSMARAALDAANWRDGIEVVSGLPHWITLRVSCHLLTADRLVRFMTEHAATLPTDNRDLLLTAFREMLLNAMEHGAGFDPAKVIEVTAARTDRAIVYHFRDPGDGFNRADLAHAVASTNPDAVARSAARRFEQGLRPGGFGILIAREIVDELVFNERGNEVLLIKHLK
jgi:anti-sigma regulatory factor (Ser/Thr protein kinase)/CheY-like chemotaxis protein